MRIEFARRKQLFTFIFTEREHRKEFIKETNCNKKNKMNIFIAYI